MERFKFLGRDSIDERKASYDYGVRSSTQRWSLAHSYTFAPIDARHLRIPCSKGLPGRLCSSGLPNERNCGYRWCSNSPSWDILELSHCTIQKHYDQDARQGCSSVGIATIREADICSDHQPWKNVAFGQFRRNNSCTFWCEVTPISQVTGTVEYYVEGRKCPTYVRVVRSECLSRRLTSVAHPKSKPAILTPFIWHSARASLKHSVRATNRISFESIMSNCISQELTHLRYCRVLLRKGIYSKNA